MDVRIHEVISRVSAVDGTGLDRKTLRRIVEAVLDAVEQQREHSTRVAAELSVRGASGGDTSLE